MESSTQSVITEAIQKKGQEYLAYPTTKSVNPEQTHAIRNCINCGKDDPQNLFPFTYDFLTKVRGIEPKDLESIGWNNDTTSTLVKCGACGCNYIRDVFITDEYKFDFDKGVQVSDWKHSGYAKQFSFSHVSHLRYCRKVIEVILSYLARNNRKKEKVSFLDFGSSLSILSPAARVYGFDTVVSYDPKFRPDVISTLNSLYEYHPLRLYFVKDKKELFALGPFDAIVCQSALEHFYDPQYEIKLMCDLLAPDGILFINCPYMPLDKELPLLKNETQITDKAERKRIQKSYHIDHLNCITARHFTQMLRRVGFKEKKTFFYYPADLHLSQLAPKNLIRFVKVFVLYVFNLLGITYKKVNFFVVKR